ncbi:GDSL-type esterase/lipase family protein [Faucicola boevrei]|uniref:GDSL-type esterase/lipase family protein n=1 Tax=Faucicola boevrei TaxID=346665 RepID=UPI000373C78F|nr:GDSL-type esterase/lipase family protein [Moraxella boevrei]
MQNKINRRQFVCYGMAFMTLPLITGCNNKPTEAKIARGSKVIALGDSLTYGYGAEKHQAYPTILAKKTGWQIRNAGINGDTSAGVLARLDEIIQQKPSLVLLGIGGNDVLRRVNPSETTENITKIVQQLKNQNINVILIAEPHLSTSALFGKASDNPIYQKIADSEQVILFAKGDGGWSEILSNEKLKSDQIHANAAGYAKFADNLYQFLQKQGLI